MGTFLGARIVATTLFLCTAAFLAEGKIYTVPFLRVYPRICDPPQNFDGKGESMLTTRFHFKTKNLF